MKISRISTALILAIAFILINVLPVLADTPTVDTFTVTTPSNSLDIPITAFTATGTGGVSGYLITESSTQPAPDNSGWSFTAPTTYTVASDGAYTLYPWAKDAAGDVSTVFATPRTIVVDTTAPTVNTFTVTTPSNSLNIPITAFTATDTVGVTGYLITTSATPPAPGAAGWTGTAPATFTVASDGAYTLYPWAKDAVGNVSNVFATPRAVSVDTTKPTVNTFTVTTPSNSLNIPITAFTATDTVGVTGYLITTSATPPLAGAAGWTGTAPATFTVASDGAYTLYPWAKDAVGNVSNVFATPRAVSVDTAKPTVNTFTVTTPSNSLNIPITAFTATDTVGVTGYLITTSATPPLAGAAGWTGTAPATFTVASDGAYTLYPWAKDAAGNVSNVFATPRAVSVDTTKPTVNTFTVTTPSNSLNIPITAFTATDTVGVTGYLITTSATPPLAGAAGWTGTAPATFTVASDGAYTLYPWAKDAVGNVSNVFATPRAVSVDTTKPTVNTFTVTTPSNSLDIPITAFTATDTVGVTGYLITTSATPPLAGDSGWTGTAPATFTVASDGAYTLYPWAKDAAGNVSNVFATPRAVSVDTAKPTVNTFTVTTPSNSLNIPITAFTATDTVGVTGYLITTSATPPLAGAAGWTGTAPATFTVASDGAYTLYPWAKDAAGNVSNVFATPRTVVVDTTAPTVNTFTVTTPSNSLDIPITAFTATDTVGVTGYLITTSATPPLAGAAGWTGTAPATFTVASDGAYTLYPWAKDAVGNVSNVFATPRAVSVDTTKPTVNTFTVTTPSNSLDIPITAFTATDTVGVTGYLITTSATPPLAGDSGWTGTAPATFTVASDGAYTLYPWAKDAVGNVSNVFATPRAVSVDTAKPTVNTFTVTTPSNSLNIPITAFTATDTVGVTGYLITTSATPPLAGAAGWTGTAPATFTVASDGAYTLYPWAKDAAGNVSNVFATPRPVSVDTIAPTVTNVTSTTANGNYTIGTLIPIGVTFSEVVNAIGTPQLTLETGTTDRTASYSGGTGTNTLIFNYSVQTADSSADLDYVSTTSLTLNGATIKDATFNNATLILPAPGTAGSLGANKAIVIDTTAPTISIGAPSVPATKSGPVTYTVTYADTFFNTSTLIVTNITLNSTGNATGSVGVTGSGLTRSVTISSITGNGTLGISIAAGTASDTAGNLAPAAGPSTTFIVDTTAPNLSWITPPPCGQTTCYYDVSNQTIQLAVNASDIAGISKVVFRRWDQVSTWIPIITLYSPPYSLNFDTSVLLPDWNQIDVRAYDNANNVSESYIFLKHFPYWQFYLPLISR